jgi:hypothetical protein
VTRDTQQAASNPIDADHVSRPDAFGRSAFAKQLARALSRQPGDDAIVVGLEGEWGSGKTHLLSQVREMLYECHSNAVIVDFNPWLITNTESLVLALLGQLAARIGTTHGNGHSDQARRGLEVSRRLIGYLSALQRVAEPALLLFDPSGTASGITSIARAPLDTMAKAIDDVVLPERLAKADVFARKDAVAEALRNFGCPIVVIIDDLDRLQHDELRSVFQAVKAVANFPGTSYLLAYDPKRVTDAFRDASFVEKIVQVAYPIPHLHPWDMSLFVKQQIVDTLSTLRCQSIQPDSEPFDKAVRLTARLCRHPRDVVRLCNRLRIALPAVQASIMPEDIVVAEALALSSPLIAAAMRKHQSDFALQPHPRDDQETEDEWVAYYSEARQDNANKPLWMKHIPEDANNRVALSKALGFLFDREPRIGVDPASGHDRRLRVPELLALYVQLSAVDGIPSPAAIDDMLSDPEHLRNALDDAGNDIPSLLEWIAKFFPKQLPNPSGILGEFLALEGKSSNDKGPRLHGLVGRIVLYLVKSSPIADRPSLIRRLVESSRLGVSVTAVMELAREHGKLRLKNREDYLLPADQRFISDAEITSHLINQWREKLLRAAKLGELVDESTLSHLLHRWHQLGDSSYQELWQLTRSLCQTERGLERFVADLNDSAEDWRWPSSFPSFLHLVWDCNELASMLGRAPFADRFTKLKSHLESKEAAVQHAKFRENMEITDATSQAT